MSSFRSLLYTRQLSHQVPLHLFAHPWLLEGARRGGELLAAVGVREEELLERVTRAVGVASGVELARLEGRLDVSRAELRVLRGEADTLEGGERPYG